MQGTKNLGIEIEVEDLSTGEIGSDRTFSDITFDRQDEFFRDALRVFQRTIDISFHSRLPSTKTRGYVPSRIIKKPFRLDCRR